MNYMTEMLDIMKQKLPRWVYVAVVQKMYSSIKEVDKTKEEEYIPKLLFVGEIPSKFDKFCKSNLTGKAGTVFKDKYLKPLGLIKSDVDIITVITDPFILTTPSLSNFKEECVKEIAKRDCDIVIALGHKVSEVLKDHVDFTLPHPEVILRTHDSGEVSRKIKQIKQRIKKIKLDKVGDNGLSCKEQDSLIDKRVEKPTDIIGQPESKEAGIRTEIKKADKAKQIVYGIVLDPYGASGASADAHGDWCPPCEIEKTAHNYMKSNREIGFQHSKKASAKVVESWIEQYSDGEYKKAMNGDDHSVVVRKFGDDVIRSGSWALGVELGDEEWKAFERGEINAFSPGGIGIKSPLNKSQMPKVSFIEMKEG